MRQKRQYGFTLAELLIALAILGVIATFTIPKILMAQQSSKYNSVAKEAVAMVAGAHTKLKYSGAMTTNTTMADLTQYMNYVGVDTTGTVDADTGGSTAITCNDGFWTCLKLHGGATLFYGTYSFAGTATTNAIWFYIDPDGVYSGTTNGPGKAEQVYVYYNGKISTRGYIASNTCDSHGCDNPIPSAEASWFNW